MFSYQNENAGYPTAQISNDMVKMKLYLPDAENGYYRGTRFDWSGIMYSFIYKGHEYFGEWHNSHNPVSSSDITGSVNGYLFPGLGFDETTSEGEFTRIGVGTLEKPATSKYKMFETYKIIDPGKWKIKKGKDWIEFIQKVKRKSGWAFVYSKKIELLKNKPGFRINYVLRNTGTKVIETDQFNHNFFIIDNGKPDVDYRLRVPFSCRLNENPRNNLQRIVKVENNELVFSGEITDDVWISLTGYTKQAQDNQFELINTKSGAGIHVQGNIPLQAFNFWADTVTICPETFIYLKVAPKEKLSWSFDYEAFLIN